MASTANDAILGSWDLALGVDKAATTRRLYRYELGRFAEWLEEHSHGDLLGVERRDVERWIADLQAPTPEKPEGLARSTIRARALALRSFYRWALEEGEIDANPMERIRTPKQEPPPPAVLTDEQLADLLAACAGRGFDDRRDSALIRFMVATGLRASEVCALTLDDIDLRARIASVRHGKGDKARMVRFDPGTAQALDRYVRIRGRHRLAERPQLWLGLRGPLTRKGLASMLRKRATLAGVGHVHPHQLRHAWAHRWLAAGGQEGDLQRLGGWADASVMRRYGSGQAVARALDAYDTVNPMGDLR